jgi:hypothetical protein
VRLLEIQDHRAEKKIPLRRQSMALPSITLRVTKRKEKERYERGVSVVLTLKPETTDASQLEVLHDLKLRVDPELKEQLAVGKLVKVDLSLADETI